MATEETTVSDVTHYVGDQCPGGHYEETAVSETECSLCGDLIISPDQVCRSADEIATWEIFGKNAHELGVPDPMTVAELPGCPECSVLAGHGDGFGMLCKQHGISGGAVHAAAEPDPPSAECARARHHDCRRGHESGMEKCSCACHTDRYAHDDYRPYYLDGDNRE